MAQKMPKSELGVFRLQQLVQCFFLEVFDAQEKGVVKFLLEPKQKSGARILVRPHVLCGVTKVLFGGLEWPVTEVLKADTSADPQHEGAAVVWLAVGPSKAGANQSRITLILRVGEEGYCFHTRGE